MELFDKDLKEVMGGRYDDGDTPTEMPVMECKHKPQAEKKPDPAPVAEFNPFPKAAPSFMDRLTSCATWACVCGGISMLLWWFQINDLMAMEAAFPCILVCTLLAGYGVGTNIRK